MAALRLTELIGNWIVVCGVGVCCYFPVAQLCHYTHEPNPGEGSEDSPERLTLAFSTADVVITGARLVPLLELIGGHDLAAVSALDARYQATLGRDPWVGRITVTHIDKTNREAP